MKIEYGIWEIELINEQDYAHTSVDNINTYQQTYHQGRLASEKVPRYTSSHGIFIRNKKNGETISSAIILESEGATGIHERGYFLEADKLWLCVSNMLYCVSLPNLDIKWYKKVDLITNFGIYPFQHDFIIHGELTISRISKSGEIKWQFGGADIFVSLDGKDEVIIENKTINVIDFEGRTYILDENGKEG
jgi:hypothetical protein